jgi:hypothetical protein
LTGTDLRRSPPSSSWTPSGAVFRGPVACRRAGNALTLTGRAADTDEILILTFFAPAIADLPDSLPALTLRALDRNRYGITCASRDWIIEPTSVHVHRDVGSAFYRAVPPRPTPLGKRLLWRVVLALAGTRMGKRLLLRLRRRA